MKSKELRMSFDPRTIEHLGIKMYSRLPNAIAELIANAYDACAKEVIVYLYDSDNSNKSIVVEDDGEGMTFDEINDKFLRIGRNRREEGEKESSCGRIVTGRKGLGKLAFFGIGELIIVETCKNGEKTVFKLDWDDLIHTPSGQDYKPTHEIGKCDSKQCGTTITLTKLKRKTEFDFDGLSKSLAKLFNFSDRFTVLLTRNDTEVIEIDNKLKYEDINPEFVWKFPDCIHDLIESEYEFKDEIVGEIITAKKPLKPGMRGITLFANGRMVNKPEFFGSSESSHFFSYTTGWLDVDFVDNWEEDVISTNRQSLDWENPKTDELRKFLNAVLATIHQDWRKQRKKKRKESINEKIPVDINNWYAKTPDEIREKIEPIVEKIVDDAELSESETNEIVRSLHELLPEYTYYHYRYIHPEIQDASREYYERGDYYSAFFNAMKRYVNKVKEISLLDQDMELDLVSKAFGENGKLKVAKKYKKPDGTDFKETTIKNIEDGQKQLSRGIIIGGRHPVAHEEIPHLRDSGLFSEKDCLDALSLLSHLMRRLDDAVRDE